MINLIVTESEKNKGLIEEANSPKDIATFRYFTKYDYDESTKSAPGKQLYIFTCLCQAIK